MLLAVCSAQSAAAAQPAATAARLLTPSSFVNSGAIHLKPAAAQPTLATAITVDATLNPLISGAVPGTPTGAGNTYSIGANYGVTAGTNEFLSFSTFNLGAGDTARFTAANTVTNIVSRVTGGTSTTIDGTLISPAYLWFINPAGVILGSGASINAPAGFSIHPADYVSFADGSRFYALPANGPNPAVLSIANPTSFGFLSNVEFDSTLSGHTTNTPIVPVNGVYTITLSEGAAGQPAAPTAATNFFFSFANFTLNAGETASFMNDLGTLNDGPGVCACNVISRVTGGISSIINGTIDATGLGALANLWFINPAGILVGATGKINLDTGGLALGSADYLQFADPAGTRFYSSPSQPLNLPASNPSDFGFLAGSTPGPISIASAYPAVDPANVLNGGNYLSFAYFEGGRVSLANVDVNLTPAAPFPTLTGAELIAATGSVEVMGSSVISNGGGGEGHQGSGPLLISSATSTSILQSQLSTNTGYSESGDITISAGTTATLNGSLLTILRQITGTLFYDGKENNVSISGGSGVKIETTTINTSVSSQLTDVPADQQVNGGNVSIVSANGPVVLANTLIDTRSNDSGLDAGFASITGGSVSITGGQQPMVFGTEALPANTAIFSGTNGSGNAGAITISGIPSTAAGTVAAQSGLVTITGSTISSESAFSTGSGGNVSISGSGVLINAASGTKQSLISANYSNAGGNAGAPGSVAVFATGRTAAGDPLAANLTAATPGVVRIVDSAVTATNTGGTGTNGSIAGLGQIWIGADLPGASGAVADDVIMAGSAASTDVSAGGIGNNLNIEANRGVWIGASATGGYAGALPNDPRTSPTQSLVSAQTATSAVSGGKILIQAGVGGEGGDRGVTIISSAVDADNQVNSQAAGTARISSDISVNSVAGAVAGPVVLSNANLTTETSGVNKAGDISIIGGTVAITGGELSAATKAAPDPNGINVLYDVGDAGSVSVSATLPDPSPGVSALTVNGAVIQSDASTAAAIVDPTGKPLTALNETFVNGNRVLTPVIDPQTGLAKLAIPNAGTVTLSAAKGSAYVAGDSTLSTVAGPDAGNAGAVSVTAPGGVTVSGAAVNTNVAARWTVDANGNPVPATVATITMSSVGGPVQLNGASVTADTSGTIAAGDINLSGASVDVTGGRVTASTTATADAGSVSMTASRASLLVDGGAQISSDASSGSRTTANAGTVTLTAANGAVQVGAATDAVNALTTISTQAGAAAGQVGYITLQGASVTVTGAGLSASTASSMDPPAGHAAISIASTTGPVTLIGADLSAATKGAATASYIDIEGPSVAVVGGSMTAQTTGTGSAGDITITASGAAGANGAAALDLSGGADLSSDSSEGMSTAANAGAVTLTAAHGTVQVGAATDSAKAPTTISTAAGQHAGQVGYITLDGSSVTVTGAVLSASTASAVDPPANHAAISIASTAGPVTLTGADLSAATTGAATASYIDIEGPSVAMIGGSIAAKTTSTGSAGDITITASGAAGANGAAALELSGGADLSSDASGGKSMNANAGAVSLTAVNGTVQVGAATDAANAPTTISTAAGAAAGQVGYITLKGASVDVIGAGLSASTASAVDPPAGHSAISIGATAGPVTLTGADLSTATTGAATAAGIDIEGPSVAMTGGSITASTTGTGSAASVLLTASGENGAAGAPALQVSGGATISVDASGGVGAGHGGALVVTSAGSVTLSGAGTALSSNSANDASGGSVTITAASLTMDGGADISANTSSNASNVAAAGAAAGAAGGAVGNGSAGDAGRGVNRLALAAAAGAAPQVTGGSVVVTSRGDVALSGAGTSISANASGSGTGGKVTLTAAGLSLTDGASIATTAKGTGNSGDIAITLQPAIPANGAAPAPVLLTRNSLITTNAAESTGGNIILNAGGSPLQLQGSAIEATAGANGNGGDVTLNDVGQSVLAASGVLAQANHGNGGVINIFLDKGALFLEDSASLVSASSNTGNNGTVTINSPQTDLNSSLAAPDVTVARAPELSANVCRRDGTRSTFVREGRGGVEPGPDNYLTADSAEAPTAGASADRGAGVDADGGAKTAGGTGVDAGTRPAAGVQSARLAPAPADLGCR